MAENVHCFLKVKGQTVEGESTITSLGRDRSIECVAFLHSMQAPREAGTGKALSSAQTGPIMIHKRLDKSSPLLAKALLERARVDAKFSFFRPAPSGAGVTEQFYTVEINDARIASISQRSAAPFNTFSMEPPMEEITFVFPNIAWLFEPAGTLHTHAWSN